MNRGPPWGWHHRHHHGPGRPWRRMGPIGRFVRVRLRRRLFVWFFMAIVFTAIGVGVAMTAISRGAGGSNWNQDWDRGTRWVGKQFGERWSDPAALRAFTESTAADWNADLELFDAKKTSVLRIGEACRSHNFLEAPVVQNGVDVGTVRACFERRGHRQPWRFAVFALVAFGALWFASGKIARRLAKPLDELSDVVKKIGSGDLTARAVTSANEPDEIGVVAEAVNDMAARLEQQLKSQRELLAAVSHELRTPLARVRLISEIARDGGATTKTWDDLDREAVEMDALVGQLLASSRIEFGTLSKRALDAGDVAKTALERAGLPATLLKVEGDVKVEADPTLLLRALANLLENARAHAKGADGLIVRRTDGRVRFEVTDRGPGVPEGGAEPLFAPFKRGEHAGEGGLGLGLHLVRRIAEAHGGRAWAEPREGGGSTFGLELAAGA